MGDPVRRCGLWLRQHWMILGPYLLVVVVACGSSFFAIRGFQHRDEVACQDRRDGRQVLREVVIKATEPGQRVDLTKIPGFADLDPATRTYISNLSAGLNVSTPDQIPLRDRLLALIPPLDC